MESTGVRGRIQVSKMTAELLSQAGKSHWVRPRDDAVTAKGKGVLKTFWLNPSAQKANSSTSSENETMVAESRTDDDVVPKDKMYLMKQERLVGWMLEILVDNIKKIVSCCFAETMKLCITKADNHASRTSFVNVSFRIACCSTLLFCQTKLQRKALL